MNYTVSKDGRPYDFSDQLSKLASEKNRKSILDHVKALANKRNLILYASSEGIPSIDHALDSFLLRKRDLIFYNLVVYLMIDPYKEKQLFVQQTLSAFVKMLKLIPKDIDFG